MAETAKVKGVMRPLYFGLGILCVGLGYVGAVTPLMPSTVFFLIALWSFKRSSPALEEWLLTRSFIGPSLRDWENDRSMTLATKRAAILMLWLSIFASMAIIVVRERPRWLLGVLLMVAIAVTWFIATRKTKIVNPPV